MSETLAANSVISHYRILSKLGAGGMGEVWLAEDTRLGRKVALKLLPAEFTEDSERVRRFTQEAKAASALNHPNIIAVHDIGECETGRFIVMEFVAGRTLRSVIATDNSLETFFSLGSQMARALSAAHANGITHRDIKPDNIMVRDDGYVKVLDFGLVRLLPSDSSDPEAMTLAQRTTPGTVMGTLAYMSPEQASGQTASSASDVFALGIVLYELATGSHPFKSETMIGYLHAITSQVPPSLTSLKSHLPAALDDLISRMLEKDANNRPSANEVAQGLQEIEKYGTSKTMAIPPDRRSAISESPKVTREEEFWVAVLPFKYRGGNTDIVTLAEGLSEDILTGLSRFSYLRVIARSWTLRFSSEEADVRAIGRDLGARYVMEGSLRQAGSLLRVSVQLVDASTGAHLWAQTYDRPFQVEEIFALQDELVPKIVSTVADWYGVLPHSMSEAVRLKPPDQLSPYEAVLRSFGYFERITPDEHAAVRMALEHAVEQAPGNADGWAMLSMMYGEEHRFCFNELPDSLGRSLAAARRAVDAAHANHFAWVALAQALFFRKEFDTFRDAAERAISLNPLDGSTSEYLGHLIAFSGDWERGCELAERARELNPNHPGWYWAVFFLDAYRKGDYLNARTFILKTNQPAHVFVQALIAAAFGQLGERAAAEKTLQTAIKLKPDFAATVRDEFAKWYLPDLVDQLMDGLRKAGLRRADEPEPATAVSSPAASGVFPSQTSAITSSNPSLGSLIKSIAVLPFQNLSGDPEQEFFADGITEEILNALAQIAGLRVAGRSSSFSFKGRNEDLRSVGAKLNVASILEGTLRRSGDRLRITAQLIDAGSGYQLWSERYDRVIEDVFNVQDEIATTIADRLQLSLKSELDAEHARPPTDNIKAYELYLKGRALLYQRGLSIEKAIDCFKQAVALDPSYAQAWAGLADGYTTSGYSGYVPANEVMPLALDAARRSLDLDSELAEAHNALACPTLLYERDYELARREFLRALELNPNYPQARAWYGLFYLQWVAGNDKEADPEMVRLLQIDPLSAYANVITAFFYACSDRAGEAVKHGQRGVELDPNSYLALWGLSLTLEANGQYEEAAIMAERALAISGRHTWALATLASIYSAWEKPESARAVYLEMEARRTREYVQPAMLAIAASAVGNVDQAIALTQEALDKRDPMFVMIARTWPQYNKLRTDRRFLEVVSGLKLPNWNMES